MLNGSINRQWVNYFPKIARGHTAGTHRKTASGCCLKSGRDEASFNKKGEYVDGHYQSQSVAECAHTGGYR